MSIDAVHALRSSLRQSQRKLTRPRQAVLDVLAQSAQHLTPAEVYRRAKVCYPKLGLTTVYRTLDLLVELGYIERVHVEGGCHSYVAKVRPHGHHLVCSCCGRAEEFAECDLEFLVQALQARTGYQVEGHILEIFGRCPACQAQGAPRQVP